jgi:hypothetical protein
MLMLHVALYIGILGLSLGTYALVWMIHVSTQTADR